mmetsp:Transcript_29597/g.77936  ORF Transcript_29597/g.77936 Transcript_29597/m.77936 type:complete len:279 (-) Transcript_29597:755-1591(-)
MKTARPSDPEYRSQANCSNDTVADWSVCEANYTAYQLDLGNFLATIQTSSDENSRRLAEYQSAAAYLASNISAMNVEVNAAIDWLSNEVVAIVGNCSGFHQFYLNIRSSLCGTQPSDAAPGGVAGGVEGAWGALLWSSIGWFLIALSSVHTSKLAQQVRLGAIHRDELLRARAKQRRGSRSLEAGPDDQTGGGEATCTGSDLHLRIGLAGRFRGCLVQQAPQACAEIAEALAFAVGAPQECVMVTPLGGTEGPQIEMVSNNGSDQQAFMVSSLFFSRD